jgi:hypothetical protein
MYLSQIRRPGKFEFEACLPNHLPQLLPMPKENGWSHAVSLLDPALIRTTAFATIKLVLGDANLSPLFTTSDLFRQNVSLQAHFCFKHSSTCHLPSHSVSDGHLIFDFAPQSIF